MSDVCHVCGHAGEFKCPGCGRWACTREARRCSQLVAVEGAARLPRMCGLCVKVRAISHRPQSMLGRLSGHTAADR